MKWVEPKPPLKLFCVNYRALLEDVCPNYRCALDSVCCGYNQKPGNCPQQNQQENTQPQNFCPDKPKEDEMRECCPQDPVTVVVSPCQVSLTEGHSHTCAPGALKCNLEDEQQPTMYANMCNK